MRKTNNSLNNPERRKRKLALSCRKKPSELLRRITSTYGGDFYCLNCFHSFRTENKRNSPVRAY